MNFLRLRPIPPLFTRPYTTPTPPYTTPTPPFIPPRSLDTLSPSSSSSPLPRPTSPTFYTARSDFYDALQSLTTAIHTASHSLRTSHLLPFPPTAKHALPPARLAWPPPSTLARALGTPLPTARLRRVQTLLTQLNDLRRIALAGAEDAVAVRIGEVLEPFVRADGGALRGRRKPVVFDLYGRTYALGKRKESAARVWMIPVRPSKEAAEAEADAADAAPQLNQQPHAQQETGHQNQTHTTHVQTQTQDPSNPPPPLTLLVQKTDTTAPLSATTSTTTILVNNLPLATYFPNPIDRQRVVRPLKLAGVLGAFNVFALVRGGGTTGQAGALAHGIAKNVVAHVPDVELILRRAKLLKRDPRMVERKKTGLAKARKRYTWVKR